MLYPPSIVSHVFPSPRGVHPRTGHVSFFPWALYIEGPLHTLSREWVNEWESVVMDLSAPNWETCRKHFAHHRQQNKHLFILFWYTQLSISLIFLFLFVMCSYFCFVLFLFFFFFFPVIRVWIPTPRNMQGLTGSSSLLHWKPVGVNSSGRCFFHSCCKNSLLKSKGGNLKSKQKSFEILPHYTSPAYHLGFQHQQVG